MQGHLKDAAWKVGERWTRARLLERAGDGVVEVEERHKVADKGCAFGRTTTKASMPFREALEFLWPLTGSDDRCVEEGSHYLTTQQIPMAADGLPLRVYGPPLSLLADDFPLRPNLLRTLGMNDCVAAGATAWRGRARNGVEALATQESERVHGSVRAGEGVGGGDRERIARGRFGRAVSQREKEKREVRVHRQ